MCDLTEGSGPMRVRKPVNQQGRMLIVDREPMWRAFVVEALQKSGYAVHLASDAQTTLREIRDDNFDLIIIDASLLQWLDAPTIEQHFFASGSVIADGNAKKFGGLAADGLYFVVQRLVGL